MNVIKAQPPVPHGLPLPTTKCCGECGRTYTHIPDAAKPWMTAGQVIGALWDCDGTHKEGPTTFFIPKSKYGSALV